MAPREGCLQIRNNLVPIGAVEMVTAASLKDAISPTMGHRVVVRGPGNSAKEKGLAKERDEEKDDEYDPLNTSMETEPGTGETWINS